VDDLLEEVRAVSKPYTAETDEVVMRVGLKRGNTWPPSERPA
jgi:hypothetical protein